MMLRILINLTAISFCISSTNRIFATSDKDQQLDLELCTSAKDINLNPLRKINREDFGYLSLLLMPLISTDQERISILEAWSFEKEGTVFVGKVRKDLLWSDGSKVSATDVANSIAPQLNFREIGEKIKIQNFTDKPENQSSSKDASGIEITDEQVFKIKLSTSVDNVQGLFREAISSGARGNRIWPIKLSSNELQKIRETSYPKIISNYPIRIKESKISIEFGRNHWISITPKPHCRKADFVDSQNLLTEKQIEYSSTSSNSKQALIAFLPSTKAPKAKSMRSEMAGWIRSIISKIAANEEMEIPEAHFIKNEPGNGKSVAWKNSSKQFPRELPDPLKIFIFSKNTQKNIIGKSIEESVRQANKRIIWLTEPTMIRQAHIALSPTRISDGRQTWFQDISSNKLLVNFLNGHQKTTAALNTIMKKSSSTVPTDNVTLQNLEESVFEEQSIAPIVRFELKLFSRKTSPTELGWTASDEWILRRR